MTRESPIQKKIFTSFLIVEGKQASFTEPLFHNNTFGIEYGGEVLIQPSVRSTFGQGFQIQVHLYTLLMTYKH